MNPGISATATEERDGALGRGLMLLQKVAAAGEAVSNGELVVMTGLPKATVSRITTQLLGAGLLRHEPRGDRFKLGPGVLALSRAFLEGLDVRT